ncbi:hypothetical protein OAN307_c02030 [Octadecabacter antarcticus 307]|uniref:Peptide methionine sulfoxide reductase n=1 Tax=Octadecabacter antarcticus 307 TaxID=391626 RepID=M9R8A0_9RHOB|nr:hypothetical protein [Octadecabacter antarcticus]AGI65970.1 hypothetical protein OAN307_c02030 [Octadecabacter antarcticus 307]
MTFAAKLVTLPLGTFRGLAQGKNWTVTRSLVSGGKGEKLVAEALDGSDYISLNLYHLGAGDLLRPCEMSETKVRRFVAALVPI